MGEEKTEFICCKCPRLFFSDHDGENAWCPSCEDRICTEKRKKWEKRTGYDANEYLKRI